MDAGNAGPFTLEGTRCHLVGRERVAVVDPGPADPDHVEAVAVALAGAREVRILVTHGHPDHSGAAAPLADRLGAPVMGAWSRDDGEEGASPAPMEGSFRPLRDGEAVPTDAGDLVALRTPGHAREHLAFHWPAAGAVFVGDLLLGAGETTWVGAYAGCVRDYLASLDRLERLEPRLLLPAHGPPIHDPADRIARFRAHRLARVAQVERVLAVHPDAGPDELVQAVYGRALPPAIVSAARASVQALAGYLEDVHRPD